MALMLGCAGPGSKDVVDDTALDAVPGPEAVTGVMASDEALVLSLSDGAMLEVPAGLVAAGVEVGLARVQCDGIYRAASFAGCLYEVTGLEMLGEGRYSLTLPEGSRAAESMAQAGEKGVRRLVDSAAAEGGMTATASAAAAFTLVAGLGLGTNQCVDAPFTACGGEVVGEWELREACGTLGQVLGESSSGGSDYSSCGAADALDEYPFSVQETLTFEASGEFLRKHSSASFRHLVLTDSCLQQVGEVCNPDCSDQAGVCECTYSWSSNGGFAGGEWEVIDAVTVKAEGTLMPYCVDGDTLKVQWPRGGGYVSIYDRL